MNREEKRAMKFPKNKRKALNRKSFKQDQTNINVIRFRNKHTTKDRD